VENTHPSAGRTTQALKEEAGAPGAISMPLHEWRLLSPAAQVAARGEVGRLGGSGQKGNRNRGSKVHCPKCTVTAGCVTHVCVMDASHISRTCADQAGVRPAQVAKFREVYGRLQQEWPFEPRDAAQAGEHRCSLKSPHPPFDCEAGAKTASTRCNDFKARLMKASDPAHARSAEDHAHLLKQAARYLVDDVRVFARSWVLGNWAIDLYRQCGIPLHASIAEVMQLGGVREAAIDAFTQALIERNPYGGRGGEERSVHGGGEEGAPAERAPKRRR